MFKWFDSAAKHPLSSPRKAKEVLADLPKDNPKELLDELSVWMESLGSAGLQSRIEVLQLFDQFAQAACRALEQEYLASGPDRSGRTGHVLHRFHELLGNSLHSCVESYRSGEKGAGEVRKQIPQLLCRTMKALGSRYQWEHLHAGFVSEDIWEKLYRLYAYAEKTGNAHLPFVLYPVQGRQTSIAREFLKTLMIACSAPDSLAPQEFGIACHLASLLSSHFVISPHQAYTHYVDLASMKPPSRLKPPLPNSPMLRFFGSGKAYGILVMLCDDTSNGVVRQITRGGEFPLETTRMVLKHLQAQWQSQPKSRGHSRVHTSVSIQVAKNLDLSDVETWTSENISESGFDAVPLQIPAWEKVSLLFFSGRERPSNLCIIRRMNRDAARRWHIGAEILSSHLNPVELSAAGHKLHGVLVRMDDQNVEIAVEAAGFSSTERYESHFGGKTHTLVPLELLGRGSGFNLWRFRIA